jgi:hypothetical protein
MSDKHRQQERIERITRLLAAVELWVLSIVEDVRPVPPHLHQAELDAHLRAARAELIGRLDDFIEGL